MIDWPGSSAAAIPAYTKAYFISTERAFGKSTPAQKSLPMFGMRVGSVTRYEQDVWDIDENIEFDLEVP